MLYNAWGLYTEILAKWGYMLLTKNIIEDAEDYDMQARPSMIVFFQI